MKRLIFAIPLAMLAGYTTIPELTERVPPQIKNAAYPELVPLEDVLGAPVNPQEEATELQKHLQARSERLASKARELQSPVLDEADRDRLGHEITQ